MSRHLSLRLPDDTFERLERHRRRSSETRSDLAKRLLDEGLRMDSHPGIVFRSGPAGRRAGLAGGPDVWEVIGVFREVDETGEGAIRATAELTALDAHRVRAAAGYYAEHRDEVDAWIERNRAAAVDAQAAWQREQRLLA